MQVPQDPAFFLIINIVIIVFMSMSWYIQRIRTFSASEVLFRVRQRVQTHFLDKRVYDKVGGIDISLPNSELIDNPESHCLYPIFEKSIDIFKPIDWHLDLSSMRRFPKSFAHKINIRSDEFGSAKHVWEVNRLLFLTRIAVMYQESRDKKLLDLFIYHVTSWRRANPFLQGVNWYSNIEVNIRLINWTYCWKLLDAENLQKSDPVFAEFVKNVWLPLVCEHADYSFKHPSLYSSANNHLISEYAGLFIAACCWNIPDRDKRLRYAQAGLEREILLQNSPEGVNREEAAEYIQFIDDFFLLAAVAGNQANRPFSEKYCERLHRMAYYLNAMLDVKYNYPMYGDGDDGFLLRPDAGGHFNNFKSLLTAFATFFNDKALKRSDALWDDKNQLIFGDSGRGAFDSLEALGDNPDSNAFFAESGHYIFRKVTSVSAPVAGMSRKEIYLHFDAAPLGFLSIAAHGHADALSFILHVDGFPVLVDSGTFTYHTHKEWRKYFMGTISHNTVRVNGANQATQAGPTMWLNHFTSQTLLAEKDSVLASHDGYDKLGVKVSRVVEFDRKNEEFVIKDSIKSEESCLVDLPFHLHPNAELDEVAKGVFEVSVIGARKVVITTDCNLDYRVACGEESPMLGWYSDHFGEKVPCKVLYANTKCVGETTFTTKIKIA